jgi:predicted GNAT family acetyltransferase
MDVHVYHNPISNRFEANVNSGLCELDYENEGADTLNYKWTFVPEESRHQGIGHKLVHEAMEFAREQQYHVKHTCPFVKSVIEENKERYRDILV